MLIHTNQNSFELSDDKILLNNVLFPKSIDPDAWPNPHNVKAWIIGNEFGGICLVWASNEQEAFDEAVDANMLDSMLAENQDYDDDSLTALGSASELFDLTYAWIQPVEWKAERDIGNIVRIIRAVENQQTTVEA